MQRHRSPVRFYKDAQGQKPAEAYFNALPEHLRLMVMSKMKFIRKWRKRDELCPFSSHILGGLWCLQVGAKPHYHLVFYTMAKSNALLVVYACASTSPAAQRAHTQKAMRLYHMVMQKENWYAKI